MTLVLNTVVLDVLDMERAKRFWCAALGYRATSEDPTWIQLAHPEGKGCEVGLQPTTDEKIEINRLHLDLAADDIAREVQRLEALGAQRIPWDFVPGATFVVMRDTEGNEFCVVRAS